MLFAAQTAQAQRLDLLRPLEPGEVTESRLRYLADKAGLGFGDAEQEMLRLGLERGIEAAVAEFMRHKPEPCNGPEGRELPGLEPGVCYDDFVSGQLAFIDSNEPAPDRRGALDRLTAFRFGNSVNAYEQRMFAHLLGVFTVSMAPEALIDRVAQMNRYVELLRDAARDETDLPAIGRAIAVESIMVAFLNLDGSRGPTPNENFGREFMGLMSIGVVDLDGQLTYTDEDVVAASAAFTGRVVEGREAIFVPENFVEGPKRLYAETPHECIAITADDAVNCAFQHPNAPIHCARELLATYVNPNPSRALIEELASVCAANDLELRPTMEVLLASRAFYDAANVDTIPKQCFEIYSGMVRAMDVPIGPGGLSRMLNRCNDGNILRGPGALFIPIESPTNPLTKIDVTDAIVARLESAQTAYSEDPAVSLDLVERALFTDKGLDLETTSGREAFDSCQTELGLADTLSADQRQRYRALFDAQSFDQGSREQKLDAMLSCYRRFLLSTEYVTR